MKVKVVISFHDAANFAVVHKVGDEIEVSEERAQKLVDLGLVKKAEGKKTEKVEEPSAPVETAPEVPEEAEKPKRRRSRR